MKLYGEALTVILSALDVGKKRLSSPVALFITWAFVILMFLVAFMSALYNYVSQPPNFSWTGALLQKRAV